MPPSHVSAPAPSQQGTPRKTEQGSGVPGIRDPATAAIPGQDQHPTQPVTENPGQLGTATGPPPSHQKANPVGGGGEVSTLEGKGCQDWAGGGQGMESHLLQGLRKPLAAADSYNLSEEGESGKGLQPSLWCQSLDPPMLSQPSSNSASSDTFTGAGSGQ